MFADRMTWPLLRTLSLSLSLSLSDQEGDLDYENGAP